ncbi:MAG: Ig-like domain-containing protein [Yoonia sp.]|uniref:Ig-like domain-containing protein n=1 Tax=Yoonia sp. TaxID=2212373 RepID=UPI00273F5E53|nr:G8 domain-containing protein [Yoonia sp.]MDP5087024.1 Ig-like domain-containing protein [Yoonia sp.]
MGDTGGDTGGHNMGDTGGDTGGQNMGDTGGDTGGQNLGDTGGDTGGHNMGDTGGDTGGHGDGHGMGNAPSIPGYNGPFPPVTTAEINAFIIAVRAEDDSGSHMGMDGMAAEHAAAMDLAPRIAASHIAIDNGDWNDPSTWHNGQVPGEGASVLIPDGIMVNYGHVSDVSLFTVRVDGMLSFATDVDSRIEFDTLLVSSEGHLRIGTEANPVQPGVNVDLVIADNGNIDTSWDPMLLSRGVVSHGEVEIFGAEKTAYLSAGADPMAGDTMITVDSIPEGWQVGDKLVITGTQLEGWYWDQSAGAMVHHESQDEEVYITGIVGEWITIDRPLQYDHAAPDGDFSAHIANMTRNVTFSSEGGDDLPVHQRGHVMFMHSDDVDVRYAGFNDLGRTDKSAPAFAVSDLGTLDYDSNIQGRYSFHFHRTGTEDQEDPAIAVGNVVDGNPGWAFVHHDSHAEFTDNIAYDVFGAAFAAESGNETGIWLRNMAIDVRGVSYGESEVKLQSDVERHDNGRTGEGFFFAGRLVEAAENIAANTTHGFVYMHRGQPITPLAENLDQPEIAYGDDTIRVDQAPIHGFRDNEAYATQIGFIVVKNGPDQNHDVRSVIEGFTAWEVSQGINLSYTSHYTFLDTTLIGSDSWHTYNTSGLVLGLNNFDVVMNGLLATGFDNGIDMSQNILLHGAVSDSQYRNFFIDAELSGNGTDVVGYNSSHYTFLSSSDLTEGRLSFDMRGATVTSLGNGFTFDGIKTDSIGSTDRQFALDVQGFDQWGIALRNHLEANGYYELSDGTNVILVEDFVADRATGELLKFAHVIELANSDSILNNIGYTNNGLLNPGGPAANAGDDRVTINVNQDVYINVLANDFDPDGGIVRVDGMTDAQNGDVFLQDDGSIMYRPNRDFTGTDSFRYWAADEEGNFTPATVTVEVWDGML